MLTQKAPTTVFLLDVDNTLFDNDGFAADLGVQLEQCFGADERERYWNIYEALREEVGYADYFGALQRFRGGLITHPRVLQIGEWILDYPFADHLYPHALQAVAHLQALGTTAILSDGDAVFQPHKIRQAGLREALQGQVLIYVHKQLTLDAVEQHYPAAHYVMVDDKAHVLAQMKQAMGPRLTTVFVRQGHYAAKPFADQEPIPDMEIACIGDLREHAVEDFLRAATVICLPAD